MILSAIVERLKRRSKGDFKGRHFEASLILQAVSWYLRYSLSYRDIEELLLLCDDRAVLCPMAKPTCQRAVEALMSCQMAGFRCGRLISAAGSRCNSRLA